uniref:Small ribosomal subunit protein bS18c n=1 Tax=Dunaliella tertiolecta TaxID=3047 RepID=A0A7S3VN46_DUNTE|mmetsp:Transcript_17651/g.46236  ORF Transcript_17651/g.46236 Transcript_17651/m.46236 type:complete len:311 (-) Transcript_17651:248-1180(-)
MMHLSLFPKSWSHTSVQALRQLQGSNVLHRLEGMAMMFSSGSQDGSDESQQPEDASSSSSSNSSQEGVASSESSTTHMSTSSMDDTAVSHAATHTLRSFEDIFGAPEPPGPQGPPSPEADQPEDDGIDMDVLAPSAQAGRGQGPATSVPREPTPGEKLLSKEYGYAAVGGVVPRGPPSMLSPQAHPRLHPGRTFMPGQTYEPEDLNPFAELTASSKGRLAQRGRSQRPMPSAEDVLRTADYKNVAFLERFLSPAGKILHSKTTRLPPNVQAKVAKQIKLARNMAFISGESLYEKRHLRFLREAEERQKRL